MTYLSEAFDCINHPLLIAKIDSCEVSTMSTKIIFSYLSNRTKRTKIKSSFSKRPSLLHGVPQWSILGQLMFNIDLIDLLYECEESHIASYTDDKRHILAELTLNQSQQNYILQLINFFHWFEYNHLKVNPGKSYLLLSTETSLGKL